MDPATSSPTNGFAKEVVEIMLKSFEEGSLRAARMIWEILLTFVSAHLLLILLLILAVFAAAFLKAMMGRWGALGSFLYNFLYFGILFVVGLIWGPEIFVADLFNVACTVLLYPACYFLTGKTLEIIGVRRSGY